MKPNLFIYSIAAAAATPFAAIAQEQPAPDFPPKKYEPRRYDAIPQKNPFVREIQVDGKEEEVEDWAKDLNVRGYTKMNGKFVVHLENKKLESEKDIELRRLRFMRLIEGEPLDVSGWGGPSTLTLLGVTPSRDPKEVEVRIQGDVGRGMVKTATIGYDEKDLKPKATAKPPVPNNNRAGRRTAAQSNRATTPRTTRTTRTTSRNQGRRVVMPPGLPRP